MHRPQRRKGVAHLAVQLAAAVCRQAVGKAIGKAAGKAVGRRFAGAAVLVWEADRTAVGWGRKDTGEPRGPSGVAGPSSEWQRIRALPQCLLAAAPVHVLLLPLEVLQVLNPAGGGKEIGEVKKRMVASVATSASSAARLVAGRPAGGWLPAAPPTTRRRTRSHRRRWCRCLTGRSHIRGLGERVRVSEGGGALSWHPPPHIRYQAAGRHPLQSLTCAAFGNSSVCGDETPPSSRALTWEHGDASVAQHGIALGRGGPVGSLHNHLPHAHAHTHTHTLIHTHAQWTRDTHMWRVRCKASAPADGLCGCSTLAPSRAPASVCNCRASAVPSPARPLARRPPACPALQLILAACST